MQDAVPAGRLDRVGNPAPGNAHRSGEHATPTSPLPVGAFAIGRQGEVSFLSWEGPTARIWLSQGRGKSWSTTAIAESPHGETPNLSARRLDPHGEPVVVVGRQATPYGWIRVMRRKS